MKACDWRIRLGLAVCLACAVVCSTGRARADDPPATPANPTSPAVRSVFVHVDSPSRVTLESLAPESQEWGYECTDPCDERLPLDRPYRLSLPEGRTSSFRIEASPGQRAMLTVTNAHAGWRGGWVFIGLGAAAVTVGALVALKGAFDCSIFCDDPSGSHALLAAGEATVVAGLALAIGGSIVIGVTSGETRMTQTVSARPLPAASSRADTAWLRKPTWRESLDRGMAGPAFPMLPLLSRSF